MNHVSSWDYYLNPTRTPWEHWACSLHTRWCVLIKDLQWKWTQCVDIVYMVYDVIRECGILVIVAWQCWSINATYQHMWMKAYVHCRTYLLFRGRRWNFFRFFTEMEDVIGWELCEIIVVSFGHSYVHIYTIYIICIWLLYVYVLIYIHCLNWIKCFIYWFNMILFQFCSVFVYLVIPYDQIWLCLIFLLINGAGFCIVHTRISWIWATFCSVIRLCWSEMNKMVATKV